MKRFWLIPCLTFALLASPAFAQDIPYVASGGTNKTVPVGDGSTVNGDASVPMPVAVVSGGGSNASVGANNTTAPGSSTQIGSVDGSGKLQPNAVGTPAYVAPGTGAVFSTTGSNIGGYDSGVQSATATPANSSHAAGTSVGGLFSVAVARTNGGSGIITNLNWKSTGGSTGTLAIRVWEKNPVNTTCTDNTAFAGSDVDDAFLITSPTSITPQAPASTTGDAYTYASLPNLTWDYANSDGTASKNLYVCAVTVATDTADENKLVRVQLSGPQN